MDYADNPGLLENKLAHAMALDMDRRLKSYDVTMSQWAILKQLWRQEGEITGGTARTPGSGWGDCTGLVQRRPDPSDKRVQRVFLTQRGRALEPMTAVFEEEVNAHALEGFSADEHVFFIRLLTRALQNCEGK